MAATSNSSSTNASPSSAPSTLPILPRTQQQFWKLALANRGRLLMDNQKVLDLTLADNKVRREQANRIREAQTAATLPIKVPTPDDPADPMGDINIDSPVTETHYHAAQPTPDEAPATAPSPARSVSVPFAVGAVFAAAIGTAALSALMPRMFGTGTPATAVQVAPLDKTAVKPVAAGKYNLETYTVMPDGSIKVTSSRPLTPEETDAYLKGLGSRE